MTRVVSLALPDIHSIIQNHLPLRLEVPEVSNTLSALVTGLVTKMTEIKLKIGTPSESLNSS